MTSKEEAEYFKWKGIIERVPSYYQTPEDRKVANMPEWVWEKYESEQGAEVIKKAYIKIKEAISYYLDCSEDKKTVMALWVIGTYLHDSFVTFPILFLNAMRGSAKSRTIKLLTKLAKDGKMLMNLTEAGLFRSEGTLGIDEFESLQSKEKQALRELLNASYKKGTQIMRMKKKKGPEGEEIVPEYFDAYRPIVMGNINGVEEVLADRCITIILEKSNNEEYISLIENYDNDAIFSDILLLLNSGKCMWCMNVHKNNQHTYTKWNDFIKHVSTLHTLHTLSTLSTLSTLEQQLFTKIRDAKIDGRNLELYFPLYLIANELGEEVFNEILEISKVNVNLKKMDDLSESRDISLYQLVASCVKGSYYLTKELTSNFKLIMGESDNYSEWLNAKWLGNGLKRLNLVIDKRRVSKGIEVTLNVEKAVDKLEMFK